MFKNLFKNSESKSFNSSNRSLFFGLSNSYDFNFSNSKFIDFYFENSPVFIATNLISESLSAINLLVKDKKNHEIVNHPILELLGNPNPFISSKVFIQELINAYVVTGNAYIEIIYAGRRNEPFELKCIRPQNVTIQSNSKDGYAQTYTCNSNTKVTEYTRRDDYRYFSKSGNELVHLRNCNPKYSSNNLLGISFFAGCQLEISQYILSSIHNNSLLKNQATPSGILTNKGDYELDENQVFRIEEKLQSKFRGAQNAGRATYLGGDFNWIQLSQSIKDMDFEALQNRTEQKIYKAAKIPLPLVTPDNMTLSNYSQAKYAFYDNCLLPLLKTFLSFLNKTILKNFRDGEKFFLWFDEASIEALQQRKFENAKNLYSSGLVSKNEARNMIGFEPAEGGDIFYQPQNLIPVGSDNFTQDQRANPSKNKSLKEDFVEIMQSYKKDDGSQKYTKEYIEKEAQKIYG